MPESRKFKDEHGHEWDVITIPSPTTVVTPELANGWTTFRCSKEIRRITPARGLDELSDQELGDLLAEAKPYGRPRASRFLSACRR